MDMTTFMSQGTIILGILVALTNIIVEVVKLNFSLDAKDINRIATFVGILLTELAGITFIQTSAIPFRWYMIVAFAVIGFIVALGSMLGYDKIFSYFKGVR